MRTTRTALVALAAVAVAIAPAVLSASDRADAPKDDAKVVLTKSTEAASSGFATLKGVKAVPMSSRELDAVKGMTIHFTTGSNNDGFPHRNPPVPDDTGWHFVNHKENNLGNGNALSISGPGYSGLCGAALKSPALAIPGQTPSGTGGGC